MSSAHGTAPSTITSPHHSHEGMSASDHNNRPHDTPKIEPVSSMDISDHHMNHINGHNRSHSSTSSTTACERLGSISGSERQFSVSAHDQPTSLPRQDSQNSLPGQEKQSISSSGHDRHSVTGQDVMTKQERHAALSPHSHLSSSSQYNQYFGGQGTPSVAGAHNIPTHSMSHNASSSDHSTNSHHFHRSSSETSIPDPFDHSKYSVCFKSYI